MGMGFDGFFRGLDISSSGLSAERLRMDVIAANIANAQVTRGGPGGGPYRRRLVMFAPAMDQAIGDLPRGVRVNGIVEDSSPFQVIYRPGHPDADAAGYVRLPNVEVPMEMVDLLTAARAYEADLTALRSIKEMIIQTLSIGK